jgi:stage V sporulation protein R
MPKPLSDGPSWTFSTIKEYDKILKDIALEFGLDTYDNQVEVITSRQMLEAYASIGLPVTYNHWRYGKHYTYNESAYKSGKTGLAYEMVINSDPCISYLMEENNLVTQALVVAHACYGHNSFFKNNFLFQEWTQPDIIVEYMILARNRIAEYEEKYGLEAVEAVLDACHAIEDHGVDKYKRPEKLSIKKEKELQQKRMEEDQKYTYEFWNTLPKKEECDENGDSPKCKFPKEPQENLLKFIENYSPNLKPWQREIIKIVRTVSQYFYPQGQTKVMNEGWASYMHYNLIYEMFDRGYLTDRFMQSFLKLHTAVVNQPSSLFKQRDPQDGQIKKYVNIYQDLNPYYLGFHMFDDIKRICMEPTKEDEEWFPHLVGTDWTNSLDYAMRNFKDESFILQYLSPTLIRKMKLYVGEDNSSDPHFVIQNISNNKGYKDIRRKLSHQYNRAYRVPDIQISEADLKGDRNLKLIYNPINDIPLENHDLEAVEKHLDYLWGFDCRIYEKK